MNQRPPNPFRPGEALSANELSQIAESAWRGAQLSAGGNAQLSRPGGGPPVLSGTPTRRVYVRITGQGSGAANSGASGAGPAISTAGPNCYSGIELTSDVYGRVVDLEDGLRFDSFAFPLVEMTDATDIPVDAIVWASPSITGQTYEFVWMGEEGSGIGSGGTSSNVKVCRVAGQPISSGSVRYYPATFRTLNSTTNVFNNGPAGASYFDCWLVQDKNYSLTVVGNGDPGPDGPGAYSAIFQDGGNKSLGGYAMPVYLTTEYPTLGPECTVRN